MQTKQKRLRKFIYLSIATACLTIILKASAFFLTKSVGLLSDALESIVNLVAAIVALIIFNFSNKPADGRHNFGHTKAEYFSSIIEGCLILVASMAIIWTAGERLINPTELANIDIGVIVSLIASSLNLITARLLIKNGKKHQSILLEADGQHLMSDVWTSVGVLVGVVVAKLSGLHILDPIIAILVAFHIIKTGFELISRSVDGLLDASISKSDRQKIKKALSILDAKQATYHKLQTRQSGTQKFINFHLLVPDDWTVKQAHDYAHEIEAEIKKAFKNEQITSVIHLEPLSSDKNRR